jgi:hypothetical protein
LIWLAIKSRRSASPPNGCSGQARLIAPTRAGPKIRLAHCWAHARRKLVELTRAGLSQVAEEGLILIRELYRIEAKIRGQGPAVRLAARQERSVPVMAMFQTWLADHRARAGSKSPLGQALAYIANHWEGLQVFLGDGRALIDSNAVKREMRPIALNRSEGIRKASSGRFSRRTPCSPVTTPARRPGR